MDESDSTPRGQRQQNRQNDGGAETNCASELIALSRVIGSLAIPDELQAFVKHGSEHVPAVEPHEPIHPDAADLLACCRRMGQAVAALTQGKALRLYVALLRTRRSASLIDAAERASPGTLARDLAALSAACHGNDDDLILVWLRLAAYARKKHLHESTPHQVRRARRNTTIDRERSDRIGAGATHSRDGARRRHAINLLTRDLGLTEA